MKKLKGMNGITLVALIVTIIILLILAGISISSLTGNGLFEKAKLAKERTKNGQELENEILADYEGKVNEYVNGSREEVTIPKSEYESLKSTVEKLQSDLEVKIYNFENNYLNIMLEKSGNTKVIKIYDKCKQSMIAGTTYDLGTLPEEYRPMINVNTTFIMGANTSSSVNGNLIIYTTGIVKFTPYVNRTTENGVVLTLSYI